MALRRLGALLIFRHLEEEPTLTKFDQARCHIAKISCSAAHSLRLPIKVRIMVLPVTRRKIGVGRKPQRSGIHSVDDRVFGGTDRLIRDKR